VELEPRVHDIGTRPKRGDPRWEVTKVFEQKQSDAGTTVYLVKWGKTWEPASYLKPKGSHMSGLIADFYNEKLMRGDMDGGTKERGGIAADSQDTTPTHDEEAYKRLRSLRTIKTTDANPDKDVHGTGHATIHINDEGQRTTHVYDRHGRHTGQLTQSRITQLHHRYTKYKRHHPEDPPDTFPEELARLMHRYKAGSAGEKSATGPPLNKTGFSVHTTTHTACNPQALWKQTLSMRQTSCMKR